MTPYYLLNYRSTNGQARAGIMVHDRVVDVSHALRETGHADLLGSGVTTLECLRAWDTVRPLLRAVAERPPDSVIFARSRLLAETHLLAPVLYPGVIFCAGANYRDHVAEMSAALSLPPEPDPHRAGLAPWHFIKPSVTSVRGTGEGITLPPYSNCVDWEAEIALVIGRPAKNVSIENALDHVAGFTIANDLSLRDLLRRRGVAVESPFHFDWVGQKCFDGSFPMGPWITPREQVPEPGDMRIRLWVGDELMQDSSSSQLIFSMQEQVAHLSSRVTLMPGDVIATGTPAGCGAARGRFLAHGEKVRIQVERIGVLESRFVAA